MFDKGLQRPCGDRGGGGGCGSRVAPGASRTLSEAHAAAVESIDPVLRLGRDDLPTPTTTSKDQPVCPCWDLHQAAAADGGSEAVRRYLVSGGDPGAEQWGNSALHVRLGCKTSSALLLR